MTISSLCVQRARTRVSHVSSYARVPQLTVFDMALNTTVAAFKHTLHKTFRDITLRPVWILLFEFTR